MSNYQFNPDHIFFAVDTETTGFFKKGNKIQEGQARVCQLAGLLFDGRGKSIMEVSTLIKPEGWSISEGAGKIHGFTDEQCERFGIAQKSAVGLFKCMAQKADLVIAHNSPFDMNMMDIELSYAQGEECEAGYNWFCTMLTNTHITGGKWPKLEETLQHYHKRGLGENAHNAMWDVQACRDIFLAQHGVMI